MTAPARTLPPVLKNIEFPVIGSPLFIISNPDLVIAQCKAGIVGSFPALNARPEHVLDEWLDPKPARRIAPDPDAIASTVTAIRAARRPLVVSGRGAVGTADALVQFLDASGALYLDTQESRGLVPSDHPSVVGAVRGAVMAQADLVITLGRKLDYQLGFGSPAVFPDAKFLRISATPGELNDNRRGAPEVLASVGLALEAISEGLGNDAGELDTEWTGGLRAKHQARIEKGAATPAPQTGGDGRIHPMAV